MVDRPSVELERLRAIGWSERDPIGVAEANSPRDEHDTYLLQVVERLKRGETIQQAAEFLNKIGAERMGLAASTEVSRAATIRTAMLISEYLKALPRDVVSVR